MKFWDKVKQVFLMFCWVFLRVIWVYVNYYQGRIKDSWISGMETFTKVNKGFKLVFEETLHFRLNL